MAVSRPERVVIVGASVAGLAAADALRDAGYAGGVTIVGAEQVRPYDRPPLSKSMVVSDVPEEPVWLRDAGHFDERGLELRLGAEAVALDPARRIVMLRSGESLPWDAVVIATGARPRTLPGPGGVVPVLRTLADLEAVREAIAGQRSVAVVGAGFIGLETAASLRARGHDVTVLSRAAVPLSAALGEDVAAAVVRLHASRGVRVEGGVVARSVTGGPGAYRVWLEDGRAVDAGAVLAGLGVAPAVEWLVGSGVRVEGGVLIDDRGRTSVPGVVAAGDVATLVGPHGERTRFEHWMNAAEQGRHVAGTILGEDRPFTHQPSLWTDQFERTYRMVGLRRSGDVDLVVEGDLDGPGVVVLHGRGEEFHAVTACGLPRALREYRRLLQRGGSWSEALAVAEQRRAEPS